jgi:hypothetical protein
LKNQARTGSQAAYAGRRQFGGPQGGFVPAQNAFCGLGDYENLPAANPKKIIISIKPLSSAKLPKIHGPRVHKMTSTSNNTRIE